MALARPEDEPYIEAAAAEFLSICEKKEFTSKTILQMSIAVAGATILEEAKGDKNYAHELLERYIRSLRSVLQEPVSTTEQCPSKLEDPEGKQIPLQCSKFKGHGGLHEAAGIRWAGSA